MQKKLYKITPSLLASYQMQLQINATRFEYGKIESSDLSFEQATELVTRTKPNQAMLIGTSVHQYLETKSQTGLPYNILDTRVLDDLHDSYLGHSTVESEVRMQRKYNTKYGDCVLSGMADVLDFDFGIDWKVSVKSKSAGQYFDSVQAAAYLWLFDVPKWFFITLKADFDESLNVIKSVKYRNMIKVPKDSMTEKTLIEWTERLLSDLTFFKLQNQIAL